MSAATQYREQLAATLTGLPLSWKRLIVFLADAVVLSAAAYLVTALTRESWAIRAADHQQLLVLAPLCTLATFWAMGIYSAIIRYVNLEFVMRLVQGVALSVLLLSAALWYFGSLADLWNIAVLYGLCASLVIVVERLFAARLLRLPNGHRTEKVLIYGAGEAGRQLAAGLVQSGQFRIAGFTDDDERLHGRQALGFRVFAPSEIAERCKKLRIDRVLLCIPSAPRERRAEILRGLEPLSVRVMVMPGMDDLADGKAHAGELREVQVEDLLGREPVAPDPKLMDACIYDQVVMITGAGGSIGSELCRQVVQWGAKRLVLFELSELGLYQIDRELRGMLAARNIALDLVPVLGNVLDRDLVERTVRENGVTTVYHAAAYKHVPLVECNPLAGIRNNVFGCLSVVEAAMAQGVANFVLISSDKAVRPTNVMGATKRLQEMIVQAKAELAPNMRMSMVRFGNVLASSGSVVPLFREQIKRGGPVTVTHPDVTRFFMTIPEAAQLVIQAGAMGTRGDLFVLEMGEPVSVLELARRMIHLSGLELRSESNPAGSIEIVFTGLRPGEKLYEELLIGSNTFRTTHQRVRLAREDFVDWARLDVWLRRLASAIENVDMSVCRQVLGDLVEGYEPSKQPSAAALLRDIPGSAAAAVPQAATCLEAEHGIEPDVALGYK